VWATGFPPNIPSNIVAKLQVVGKIVARTQTFSAEPGMWFSNYQDAFRTKRSGIDQLLAFSHRGPHAFHRVKLVSLLFLIFPRHSTASGGMACCSSLPLRTSWTSPVRWCAQHQFESLRHPTGLTPVDSVLVT
jgi:hypothetical protein